MTTDDARARKVGGVFDAEGREIGEVCTNQPSFRARAEAAEADRDEARAEAEHWHEAHLAQMEHDAARIKELERHVELLQEKDNSQTCACSYDYPDDVCMAHAPLLKRAEADRDRLSARVGEAERLLAWYGEQARLARLIHSEGDAGRDALASDGGRAARDFLATKEKTDG